MAVMCSGARQRGAGDDVGRECCGETGRVNSPERCGSGDHRLCSGGGGYDSAARAREVLNLNTEDIDFAKKRGTVIGKGGDVETIQWSTDTARVLPAVLRWHHRRRESGPVFLSNRKLRG